MTPAPGRPPRNRPGRGAGGSTLPAPGRPAGTPQRVPRLTHSQARGIAESIWGAGGTKAFRTNRAGAFCFACSAHGGFVIDDRALTERERALLTEAGFTADRCPGVRDATGRIITIRHPLSARPRKAASRAPVRGERADPGIPVWTFEEDDEWACVYALTGIRAPGSSPWPEERLVAEARQSLGRWHPKAAEAAARAAQGAPHVPADSLPARGRPGRTALDRHAADALVSASAGNTAGAARAVRALEDAGELTLVMYRWVDTLTELSAQHGCPFPARPGPARPRGRALWAEQFITARAAMDHRACADLTARIPRGGAARYARALAGAVAGRIRMIPVTGRDLG